MLEIKKNQNLSPYLTIKVGALAKFFAVLKTKEDFFEALTFAKKNNLEIFILGGGSNTVVVKTINALVLKNEIKGLKIKKETKTEVFLEIMSGESWMKTVFFSVEKGLYGLENLASIYGTVGAAPIQNIGAYGAEFSQVFHSLSAYNLKTAKEKIFTLSDCHFAYRDSVFKKKYKNKYFIYSLVLRLKKSGKLNLNYGSISQELIAKGIKNPTPKDLAQLITDIRNSKLPNPNTFPNSGSFFKNPEIKIYHFNSLKKVYPNIPMFPSARSGYVKVPAGWLIEEAGLKGRRFKNVGMYAKQALILVNYGQAKPTEILQMINRVKREVKKLFAIDLEAEVNII